MERAASWSSALHLAARNDVDRTFSLNTVSFFYLSLFFRGAPALSLDYVNLYIVPDLQRANVGFFDFTVVQK